MVCPPRTDGATAAHFGYAIDAGARAFLLCAHGPGAKRALGMDSGLAPGGAPRNDESFSCLTGSSDLQRHSTRLVRFQRRRLLGERLVEIRLEPRHIGGELAGLDERVRRAVLHVRPLCL